MAIHHSNHSKFLPPLKQCRNCKAFFPRTLVFFHKDTTRKDGLQYLCKPCQNAATLVSHRKNIEKHRARVRAYYASHKEELAASQRAKVAANPEKARAYSKAMYQKHIEKRRAHLRHRRKTQREVILAQNRRYLARHPGRGAEFSQRRRARTKHAPVNNLTAAQWAEIKAAYGHRCVYCGSKGHQLTQDHITPLSRGGSHTVSNIVPACRSCNSRKYIGDVLTPIQPLLLTIVPGRKE